MEENNTPGGGKDTSGKMVGPQEVWRTHHRKTGEPLFDEFNSQ